jgi:hypothetical protein
MDFSSALILGQNDGYRYPLRKKKIVTPSPPGTRAFRPEGADTTISTKVARMPSRDGLTCKCRERISFMGVANSWA